MKYEVKHWKSAIHQPALLALGVVTLMAVSGCKDDSQLQEAESARQQLQYSLDNKEDQLRAARRESLTQTRKIKELESLNDDLRSENNKRRLLDLNDPNRSRYMAELEEENQDLKALNEAMNQQLREMSGGVVLNRGNVDEQVQELADQIRTLKADLDKSKQDLQRSDSLNSSLKKQVADLRILLAEARTGNPGTGETQPEVKKPDDNRTPTPPRRQYVEKMEENIPDGNALPGPAVYLAEDYARALRNSPIPGQEKVTWSQGFEVHFNEGKWFFHKTNDDYLIEFQGKVDEHFIKHFPQKNIQVPVGSSVVFIWSCNPRDKTVTLKSIHIGKSQVTGNLNGLYATLAELY